MSGIIKNVKSGDITRVNAKLLFDEIIKTGKDVDSLIRELELSGEVNKKDIVDIVGMLINNNPEILADYANNPDEVLNYFIGNILIHTQGKAKIEHIEPLIIEILKTLWIMSAMLRMIHFLEDMFNILILSTSASHREKVLKRMSHIVLPACLT